MAFNIKVSQIKDFNTEVTNIATPLVQAGPAGPAGADGVAGPAGADGVVDGISLDPEFKQVLEFQSGLKSPNLFNKDRLIDGYFASTTNGTITPPTAGEKISEKIWVKPGWYGLYNSVSTGAGIFIKLFQPNGTYVGHFLQTSSVKQFEVSIEGYIQFDVNRNQTALISSLVFNKYNIGYDDAANQIVYGNNTTYAPYNDSIPKVEIEATDNLNIGTNWIKGNAPGYVTDAYTVIQIGSEKFLTLYDTLGSSSFGDSGKPQVIEYNATNTVVKTQTSDQGQVSGIADANKYKKWILSPTTTYVHLAIPSGNTANTGALNTDKLQSGFRITNGYYFTQETSPYRIKSINGVDLPKRKKHPMFGKKIAIFGDSIFDDNGTVGSRSSTSQNWIRNLELQVFNYAVGSADLFDNPDTTGVIDCGAATVNTENVVSNQIGCMINNSIVPDIVLISGGTNDANDGKVVGDIAQASADYLTPANQNKQEMYDWFFWAAKTLRDHNPDIKIIFIGAQKSVETSNGIIFNSGLTAIRAAMKASGEKLGIPYFSLENFIPILDGLDSAGNFIANKYMYDYLHPTIWAKENLLSPYILNKITDIFSHK